MVICNTLQELRENIDVVDNQIVELIALRNSYIKQAAKFKQSVEEIKTDKRISDVIERVRLKAIELGVSPNLVNDLYVTMINEMLETEIAEFQNAKSL